MFEQQRRDPHQHVHVQLHQAAQQGATRASLHLREDHVTLVDNRPLTIPGECRIRLTINVRPPGSRWQLLELLTSHPAPSSLQTTLVFHQDGDSTIETPMRRLRDRVALDLPDQHSYLTPADGLSPITIVQPNGASHQASPYGCSTKPGINQAADHESNRPVDHQAYALVHDPEREIPFPPSPNLIADLHAQLAIATLQLAELQATTAAGPVWPDANTLALATIRPRYLDIPPRTELIRPHVEKIQPAPSTARRLDDPGCLRLTPRHAYVPKFPKTHEQELVHLLKRQEPSLVPVQTHDTNVPRISLAGVTITNWSGYRAHYPATPENDPVWPGHFPTVSTEAGIRQREYTFRIREQGARTAKEFTVDAPP